MKKLLKILPVLMIICMVFTPIFATVSMEFPGQNGTITKVDNSVRKVWGTVVTIVQILAFAAVIFAGLSYMFSSADKKADIKRSLGILALGAILVFAASTVIKFVVSAADEII